MEPLEYIVWMLQQLYQCAAWQSQKITELEQGLALIQDRDEQISRQIADLLEQMKKLERTPGNHIEKIDYHFDQLKVERLDGTLIIGITPGDTGTIDDMNISGTPSEDVSIGKMAAQAPVKPGSPAGKLVMPVQPPSVSPVPPVIPPVTQPVAPIAPVVPAPPVPPTPPAPPAPPAPPEAPTPPASHASAASDVPAIPATAKLGHPGNPSNSTGSSNSIIPDNAYANGSSELYVTIYQSIYTYITVTVTKLLVQRTEERGVRLPSSDHERAIQDLIRQMDDRIRVYLLQFKGKKDVTEEQIQTQVIKRLKQDIHSALDSYIDYLNKGDSDE